MYVDFYLTSSIHEQTETGFFPTIPNFIVVIFIQWNYGPGTLEMQSWKTYQEALYFNFQAIYKDKMILVLNMGNNPCINYLNKILT